MIKRRLDMRNTKCKILLSVMLFVVSIPLILSGCTGQKNDQNYVTARYDELISKSEDAVCWSLNVRWGNIDTDLYIEKDGEIKSKYDYKLNMDPYYNSPIVYGDYLYYIGGTYNYDTKDVYIARIDYTKKNPEIEQLTENYNDIDSYTVLGNTLYFSANKKVGEISIESNVYIKELSNEKEEVLFTKPLSYFCTNGKKIISSNEIYDIDTKTVEMLNENEKLMTLGVFNNNYYCYFTDKNSEGYPNNYDTVLQIDLNNYSAKKICEIPHGMTDPRLCDDKIIYAVQEIDCSTVGFYYYDIPTGEVVTVIESDNSTERYIDDTHEPIPMDYIIFDNCFYFHYGDDAITRVDMDTKKETVFKQLPAGTTDEGDYKYSYEWLSPKEFWYKSLYY